MVGEMRVKECFEIYFEVKGLYPEERDYINRRLELIRDTVHPLLEINYTVLKRSSNRISAKSTNIISVESALKLYELLNAVSVPNIPTDYADYIPLDERDTPEIDLKLVKKEEIVDYNTSKTYDMYD